jgi:predicted nucleic acid-binding protein
VPFIIDASISAAWIMPDEIEPVADLILDQLIDDEALAPSLWWFEVRNLLIVNERRKRLTTEQSAQALADLQALAIRLDQAADDDILFKLCRQHRLSVYDAAYLELALRERLPLATLDASLASAARAEGVRLLAQP